MIFQSHFEKFFIVFSIFILLSCSYIFNITTGIAIFGAFFSICLFIDQKIQNLPNIRLDIKMENALDRKYFAGVESTKNNYIICKINNMGNKDVFIQEIGFFTRNGNKLMSELRPVGSNSASLSLPHLLKPGFSYEFRERNKDLLEKLGFKEEDIKKEIQGYVIDSIDTKYTSEKILLT